MERGFTLGTPAQQVPAASPYWDRLDSACRSEFLKLRLHFHQGQKAAHKDRRLASFSSELEAILNFCKSDPHEYQLRCILSGIAFAGPFVCVNTRQLKSFLGRCKSSINGSFQQLGYNAIKTKSKARACILSILPILNNDATLARQWTVRKASNEAMSCFVSNFNSAELPVIADEDFFDDHRISDKIVVKDKEQNHPAFIARGLEFDLPNLGINQNMYEVGAVITDSFFDSCNEFTESPGEDPDDTWEQRASASMSRSMSSVFLPFGLNSSFVQDIPYPIDL